MISLYPCYNRLIAKKKMQKYLNIQFFNSMEFEISMKLENDENLNKGILSVAAALQCIKHIETD